MTLEEKLKGASEDYANNKVDYNITAFQKTEVPALVDLVHDSFEAGYRYALSICQEAINEACKKQREICADQLKLYVDDDRIDGLHKLILNAPSPLDEVK